MRPATAALMALGIVIAQAAYSQAFTSSLAPPVAQSDVANALAAAQAAQAAAATAVQPAALTSAIAAATPSPCPIPLPDTLVGTVGSNTPCMDRPDRTRPTAVQRANVVTTDANGSWAVTFGRSFTSTSPIVHAEPVQPGGNTLPYQCGVTTRTATTASGTCWAATSQTTTVSLGINLTSNPYASKVPQGTAVMVVAGEPSQ